MAGVDVASVVATAGVFRGTELTDAGTTDAYVGGLVQVDARITALLARRAGIDLGVSLGVATAKTVADPFYGRVEGAFVMPVLLHDEYSLLAGLGAGITAGDRFWWADVRVYPYALARFTWAFTPKIATFAQAAFAPLDTTLIADRWVTESRFEIGASVGHFFSGARVSVATVENVGEVEASFYLGFGAR